MRFLSASQARVHPHDCEEWMKLEPNASRSLVSGGHFVHDNYAIPFEGDFDRAVDALMTYKIFTPQRMYPLVCTPDHRIALDSTIVQRVVLGPAAIETAVRVIELEQTNDQSSYAYATLRGHPEQGIASFSVSRSGNMIVFRAEAWSRAGSWLTRIGRPVSRFLQRTLTKEAVASFPASVAE